MPRQQGSVAVREEPIRCIKDDDCERPKLLFVVRDEKLIQTCRSCKREWKFSLQDLYEMGVR